MHAPPTHRFVFADKVKVNDATIVESEVFVYNLGTMFYTDKVLFTNVNNLPPTSTETVMTIKPTAANGFTTASEIEPVPDEIAEEAGSLPDVLFADGAATTDETSPTVKPTTQNATIK